jgi:hypothetical protein
MMLAISSSAAHRSMATTKKHVHLAGVVFRDDANARSSGGCSG